MSMKITDKQNDISNWCSILSPAGHQHCGDNECRCLCHIRGGEGQWREEPARPHSFPRPVWELLGVKAKWARVTALAIAHRRGLQKQRQVVALRALGTGLEVPASYGDGDLVDLEADATYR